MVQYVHERVTCTNCFSSDTNAVLTPVFVTYSTICVHVYCIICESLSNEGLIVKDLKKKLIQTRNNPLKFSHNSSKLKLSDKLFNNNNYIEVS